MAATNVKSWDDCCPNQRQSFSFQKWSSPDEFWMCIDSDDLAKELVSWLSTSSFANDDRQPCRVRSKQNLQYNSKQQSETVNATMNIENFPSPCHPPVTPNNQPTTTLDVAKWMRTIGANSPEDDSASSEWKMRQKIYVSFYILNGIRDACRSFLSPPHESLASTNTATDTSDAEESASYQSAFPSLSSTTNGNLTRFSPKHKEPQKNQQRNATMNSTSYNLLDVRQKPNAPKKNKRRIRPTKPSSHQIIGGNVGNISMLPSEDISNMRDKLCKPRQKTQTESAKDVPNVRIPSTREYGKMGRMVKSTKKYSKIHESVVNASPQEFVVNESADPCTEVLANCTKSSEDTNMWTSSSTTPNCKTLLKSNCNSSCSSQVSQHDSLRTEQKNIKISAPKPNSDQDERRVDPYENIDTCLDRLVDIYTSVLRNNFTSTLLEVHYLLRLLGLPNATSETCQDLQIRCATIEKKEFNTSSMELSRIFYEGKQCRRFASKVLQVLEESVLKNLGDELIKALTKYPPMMSYLPDMVTRLRSFLEANHRKYVLSTNYQQHKPGSFLPSLTHGSSSTSLSAFTSDMCRSERSDVTSPRSSVGNPVLALPFEQNRDSRHNYRSEYEMALFQNREECRDFFFSNIRSFQNSYVNKMMGSSEVDRKNKSIEIAAKKLVGELHPQNMSWFAELFCSLLTKIGWEDVQETDVEIISHVKDGKKLQKLHQRMTTKPNQINISSKTLVFEDSKKSCRSFFLGTPATLFPGHQEFFYLFLLNIDSHNFGQHLCRRIVGIISTSLSTMLSSTYHVDASILSQNLIHLKLLSKFLGVLVFSPNWYHLTNNASSLERDSFTHEATSNDAPFYYDFFTPILPLWDFIQRGRRSQSLIAVIPWILEFLSMSKWDSLSQQSSYYKKVFSLLRHVQHEIIMMKDKTCTSSFLCFELETFFSDVVGFSVIERFSFDCVLSPDSRDVLMENEMGKITPYFKANLDCTPFQFGLNFLAKSFSHWEPLYQLLTDVKTTKELLSGGPNRKMRPSSLSSTKLCEEDILDDEKRILNNALSMAKEKTNYKATLKNFDSFNDKNVPIQTKLVHAFFNQHKDLQIIGEFVTGNIVKNVCLSISDSCIIPILKDHVKRCEVEDIEVLLPTSKCFVQKEWNKLVQIITERSCEEAQSNIKSNCEKLIRDGIKTLASPKINDQIIETAIEISLNHAITEGYNILETFICVETPRQLESYLLGIKRQKSKLASKIVIESLRHPTESSRQTQFDSSALKQDSNETCNKMRIEQILVLELNEVNRMLDMLTDDLTLFNITLIEPYVINQSKRSTQVREWIEQYVTLGCSQDNALIAAIQSLGKKILLLLQTYTKIVAINESHDDVEALLKCDEAIFAAIEVLALFSKLHFAHGKCHVLGVMLCTPSIMRMFVEVPQKMTKTSSNHTDTDMKVEKSIALLNTLIDAKIITESELERSFINVLDVIESYSVISQFCTQKKYHEDNAQGEKRIFRHKFWFHKIRKILKNKSCQS